MLLLTRNFNSLCQYRQKVKYCRFQLLIVQCGFSWCMPSKNFHALLVHLDSWRELRSKKKSSIVSQVIFIHYCNLIGDVEACSEFLREYNCANWPWPKAVSRTTPQSTQLINDILDQYERTRNQRLENLLWYGKDGSPSQQSDEILYTGR